MGTQGVTLSISIYPLSHLAEPSFCLFGFLVFRLFVFVFSFSFSCDRGLTLSLSWSGTDYVTQTGL